MALQTSDQNHPTPRSAGIAAILRDEILSGRFRPGERLPSERDLSDRFQVSRGVIREALKKLDQLGLASIQRGGARVVPIESCTLDVLGPLLDLHEIPDPKLVDEVLQIFGVLLDTAAREWLAKASDDQIEEALTIIDEILSHDVEEEIKHQALRRLADFYIDAADHLVLRLMINGLRTSFMTRMARLGGRPRLDRKAKLETVNRLRDAIVARDTASVGTAMKALNRLFRDGAREALQAAEVSRTRNSA